MSKTVEVLPCNAADKQTILNSPHPAHVQGMPITQDVAALRCATDEIVEVNVDTLGINVEHLVRSLSEEAAYELAEKDASLWEPIEIRMWPASWEKPTPSVLYHVLSGNHRTRAAQIKGLPTLRARIVEAETELEYLQVAIRSNTQHGRNFTPREYEQNARKLAGVGMSVTDIASLLGYNKSTISRWLSGADSHAAAKRERDAHSEEVTYTIALPRVAGPDAARQKIMGLVTADRIEAPVVEARAYLSTLKPAQQTSLLHLYTWIGEVLHG